MESDDDFLPPSQFGRSQHGNSIFRSQSVTSSSTMRTQGVNRPAQPIQANTGPSQSHSVNSSTNRRDAVASHSQSTPGTSHAQPVQLSPEERLSQIQDGFTFLLSQVQQLTQESGGIKLPASKGEQKPYDKKPNTREQCQICKKTYANTTTLFRHYRAIHEEMNPEKYHGFSLNNSVVNLNESLRNIISSTSAYVPPSQSSIDNNRATHSTVVQNVSANNLSNNENMSNNCETVKDKMHKCEDCACYFEERSKFDEHMKVQHGFEVVCKICNKNLLFKDIDAHVKDSHPDVYSKKNAEEKKEKIIIQKVMKKQGKRVQVFVCTECNNIMYDKLAAERHSRSHKKGLKIKTAPRSSVSRTVQHTTLTVNDNNDRVLFTCDNCNVCTGSYDAAVDHSQNHITNMSYSVQCVTQSCPICKLKFEPLCYKKHMDLHYNNNELHKESFKYYKYKYQLLLSDKWFECFDMTDPILKDMISQSVYVHTRSVKMRIMGDGLCTVYKCCQCDKFVEPAAVANHTVNYDTCLKVKSSYGCDICNRKYNNRLARDRHTKDHNSKVSFKVVIFNNRIDKEFNTVLNDPNITFGNFINTAQNEHEPRSSDANNNSKVIYKCLCGLCFVHKQTATAHKNICPGKNPKKSCPKCNNMFDSEELIEHCIEHHLNEVTITVENVTPDAIVIDSDEEFEDTHKDGAVDNGHIDVIEISSSDEENAQNEYVNKIKIDHCSNEDEASTQDLKGHENVIAEPDVSSPSQVEIQFQQDTRDEVEESLGIFENDAITDDDSQDTINYEHVETPAGSPVPSIVSTCSEIKCVPTDLLLDPYLVERGFSKIIDIGMLKKEITTDIEIMRHDIETITESLINEPFDIIKEEKSCLFNPTDFSNIRRRPSLRPIDMIPSSSNISQEMIVESLLTDDEDEQIIPNNEKENNISKRTASNDAEMGETSEELFNETSVQCSDMRQIVCLNSQELVDKNMIVSHEQSVRSKLIEQKRTDSSTNKHSHGVKINDIRYSFLDTEIQNNEDTDDDLFLSPSCQDYNKACNVEFNQIEKVISLQKSAQPTEDQLLNSTDKEISTTMSDTNIEEPPTMSDTDIVEPPTMSDTNIEETPTMSDTDIVEPPAMSDTDIEEPPTMSDTNIEEPPTTSDTSIEDPDSRRLHDISEDIEIGSIGVVENTATLYPNNANVKKETDKEKVCDEYVPTEHNMQTNHDEDTLNFEETHPEGTSTNNIKQMDNNVSPELILSPIVDTTNIKKEFVDYMNVKIKSELIAQNEQNMERKIDKDDDLIKMEPKDTRDSEYKRNKENFSGVTYSTNNYTDKNCVIS